MMGESVEAAVHRLDYLLDRAGKRIKCSRVVKAAAGYAGAPNKWGKSEGCVVTRMQC